LAEFTRANLRQTGQPEVQLMGQTIAEALKEEGALQANATGILEGKRETLLRLLQVRFKRVSPAVAAKIRAAQDNQQLDAWLDAFVTADKISAIPFQSIKKK
jgi:hypothetical protein